MPVTYTKEQRELAKKKGRSLVTIAVPGFEYQGAVSAERAAEFRKLALAWVMEGHPKKQEPAQP